LPQDLFIQSHLSQDDYLIVSVGGNDVALAPTETTRKALASRCREIEISRCI